SKKEYRCCKKRLCRCKKSECVSDNYVIGKSSYESKTKDYPISVPGFGAGGKTNEWRLERPVINQEKCIKCLICWIDCPEATIIRGEEDKIDVNYDYCKGCGICAKECPAKAIDMQKEIL
ncbi:MAG: 4Fe-4S binding protein, partial [Thermoplasmata archaeon]